MHTVIASWRAMLHTEPRSITSLSSPIKPQLLLYICTTSFLYVSAVIKVLIVTGTQFEPKKRRSEKEEEQ